MPAEDRSVRILADSWYGEALGLQPLSSLARGRIGARLLQIGLIRGAALWWYGRRYDAVLTVAAGAPTRALLTLERIFSRRRRYLIVLEFIPLLDADARVQWGSSGGPRARVSALWWRLVAAPALRRSLLFAQALTQREAERNAEHLSIDATRFRLIPFFSSSGTEISGEVREGVLASGRAACDWETVFAAAAEQSWPLTVVCSAADLPRVNGLNAGGRACVHVEITPREHARLVRHAAVYLLALREARVSSGHVRLFDAAEAGTAVVAASVEGLQEYVEDGETALLYPPGDHLSARVAVDRLLGDADLRGRLVSASRERGRGWGREQYLEAIRREIEETVPPPTVPLGD